MSVPTRLSVLLFNALLSFAAIQPLSASLLWSRSLPVEGFFNPEDNSGTMLTSGYFTSPAGLGEPLNAIISANSDAAVLKDQEVDGGLRNYFLSVGFSAECLGQHLGDHQAANLGDGLGDRNETAVIRYNYGDPALGSCKETVQGGNHFRYWVQNGSDANRFVSFCKWYSFADRCAVVPFSWRKDYIVGNITGSAIPTSALTNTTTYDGTTNFGNYTYHTDIAYTGGLLQNSSNGINHFASVGGGPNNITAIDGLVAVLTVKITGRPASRVSSGAWILSPYQHPWTFFFISLPLFGLGLDLI
ncbi:hypothetical protein BU17DRAFT_57478 [Hysterangium stoloniferum]|nr:hypothetical protein BU17DRAFT_57478 [Hysterangium stoloniferum]